MTIQVSLFSALLLISAVITFILSVYGWRNRAIPICQPFTLLMAAATVWAAGEAILTMNIGLTASTFVNVIEYPGVVTVPVAWFMLSLYYAGMERFVTRRTFPLFFIVPFISVVVVATNPLHYLYYTSVTPEIVNGITLWHYNHGPLFQVLILYSYALSFLAFFLVFSRLFTHSDYYRKQTVILLIASAIPFLFNILYVTQPAGFPEFDITPFSFAIMGVLIAFGIIRFRLFSIAPVAHTSLFNGMVDAVFVTDQKGTVIDLNPASLTILGIAERDAIGKNIGDLFPELKRQEEDIPKPPDNRREIRVSHGTMIRYFDLTDLPIYSQNRKIGHVTMLHDITERRTALNALEAANTKLNLLSDITRHDIMNQLTVLLSYIELSKEKISDPDTLAYIEKEEHSALTIKHQIEFTSEYQDIGKQAPKWQNINESFHVASMGHNLGTIVITGDPKNIEIYTDPLFGKVFYNLIDNSLRYGGERLKNIWISSQEIESGLIIRYQDDGAGIPDPDKKKLFTRGYGRTGGMGLFLIREILSITGITIIENGIPGTGVRFEITVPKGAYKYSE